ncbi:hypothetical protein DUI87_01365 [Hirundo rustica rustica]|uniref:Integrase catalytic domain-containing protein n=1 Tax=Hirundo rustica rustica TaxID=333673 RepID=A0A3M0L974_HIRRU|nr:hypothetical protein DUI87_01365 [Hirundo rustica rustica]
MESFASRNAEFANVMPMVYRIEPSIDVTVFITTPDLHPTGIIGQWNDDWTDPLHVLEWVFLPHQPHKTATALFELIARLIIKVNPRGLKALELWQTDVTQVAEFGRLKYVHVTVDTFSSAMWASAHTGEKARDVIAH